MILQNGKTYRFTGDANTVDPSVLGSALQGAILSHNHPADQMEYSFSESDVKLFKDFAIRRLRGVDERFIYELSRDATTVAKAKPLFEMTEYGGRDEYMKETAKNLGVGYWRKSHE